MSYFLALTLFKKNVRFGGSVNTEISDTFSFKAFGCKTDSYASQTLRFPVDTRLMLVKP